MNRVLEALWYGDLSPCEACKSETPEIGELTGLMQRNKDSLCETLTPSQCQYFEKYLDCSQEYMDLISMHTFLDGFCLANKLMAESLTRP